MRGTFLIPHPLSKSTISYLNETGMGLVDLHTTLRSERQDITLA